MVRETQKKRYRFMPIVALILTYLLGLNYAFSVISAQNDISYLILAGTVTLPYLIGIVIATLKLLKKGEID